MKQLNIWAVLGIWATISFGGALFAAWQGYGGHAFATTVAAFSMLLLVMLSFAARGIPDTLVKTLGPTAGAVLGALLFAFYFFYLVGTGSLSLVRVAVMAGFVFAPIALAYLSGRAAAGSWLDFLTLAGVWVFVKFGPSHWLWPYPGGRLAYVFTVLVAVDVALATFVLVRHVNGIGYSIGWGKNWALYVPLSLAIFACVAIPMGTAMHFILYAPQWSHWRSFAGLTIAILFFTAWPEEFLFRGLLQNMLTRSSKNEFAGWWTASMLFGFSHITNMGFPNWRYVTLAAVAGLFYGWTWRRCGSIFASALVHAGVDAIWHFFFRTL